MTGFPTLSSVRIDPVNSAILVGYFKEHPSLARQVFPPISVDEISARYFVMDKGDFHRDEARRRAPGTTPVEFNMRVSNDRYSCDEWALRRKIPKELEASAQFDLRAATSRALGRKIMLRETIEFISTFMTTGVWGGAQQSTLTALEQFSNPASTPVDFIRTIRRNQGILTGGFKPNVWVMNDEVSDRLMDHPDVRNRMPTTVIRNVTQERKAAFLSEIFEMETIICDSSHNVAGDGLAVSMQATLTDTVLLAYRTPTPVINEPSAGYVFSWKGFDGGGSVEVYPHPDEGAKSNYLAANSYIDQKLVAADCGYLLLDCLA